MYGSEKVKEYKQSIGMILLEMIIVTVLDPGVDRPGGGGGGGRRRFFQEIIRTTAGTYMLLRGPRKF